jgi:16S rRNA (adenine1518-N6/adenine1519-N6)-dimethyltransferase
MLKKSLSQNLIKDKNLLRKMVRLADVTEDDMVIEIGAGHGDLTRAICEKAGSVYSVELDRSFGGYLEPLEKEQKNLKVLFSDILEVPFSQFGSEKKIKVIGNIPYGITGPILFKIMEERAFIESAYLTTQREIGQRIASSPHKRSYGAVSVICQLVADVKMLLNLKANIFIPPPKVDSVYFSMVFKGDAQHIDDSLIRFIKHCFENKRKYLKHALLKYYDEERVTALYTSMGFSPSIRAEEIEPETFVEMYRQLNLS